MTVSIGGAVGKHLRTRMQGHNAPVDVLAVQRLLNASHERLGTPRHRIAEDSRVGLQTVMAIRDFQFSFFRWADGLVHPNGITLDRLNRTADGEPYATMPRQRSYNFRVAAVNAIGMSMNNDCWAVVGTTMMDWRHRRERSSSVEQAMASLGREWLTLYQQDQGLPVTRYGDFARACGLTVTPIYHRLSVDEWLDLLQTRGPVFVFMPSAGGWTHANIVIGMRGDGSVNGTDIMYIDPNNAQTDSRPFYWFDHDFEQTFRNVPRLWPQFWHY